MKKVTSLALIVGGLTLATVSTLQNTALAEEGRFASYLSPKNPVVEFVAEPFIERVKKDSNGELTYKLYAGGSLLGGKNTAAGLRDGIADIGQIVFNYNPSEFPHSILIADMAMYGNMPAAISAATTEFMMLHCDGCIDDYKRNGIVVLGGASATAFQLMSKSDLSTLASLEGKKIRTPGGLYARWATSVGAVPVSIPSSEMYEALSRGQVDVVVNPLGAMKSHSLWDIAKKVTMIDIASFRPWGVFSISAKHWNGLTDDQRTILMKNAAIGLIDTSYGYQKKDDEVLAMVKEKEVELIEPTAEVKNSIEEFKKADWAVIIEQAKTKYKIEDPEPLMNKMVDLIKKWEEKFEPIKDDNAAMSDMLYDEVLSKVDAKSLGQ